MTESLPIYDITTGQVARCEVCGRAAIYGSGRYVTGQAEPLEQHWWCREHDPSAQYRQVSDEVRELVRERDALRAEEQVLHDLTASLRDSLTVANQVAAHLETQVREWEQRGAAMSAEVAALRERNARLVEGLTAFVHACANVNPTNRDPDLFGVRMFQVWLKAMGILGLTTLQGENGRAALAAGTGEETSSEDAT